MKNGNVTFPHVVWEGYCFNGHYRVVVDAGQVLLVERKTMDAMKDVRWDPSPDRFEDVIRRALLCLGGVL